MNTFQLEASLMEGESKPCQPRARLSSATNLLPEPRLRSHFPTVWLLARISAYVLGSMPSLPKREAVGGPRAPGRRRRPRLELLYSLAGCHAGSC